jgi:preprotein translocase subunit YajC
MTHFLLLLAQAASGPAAPGGPPPSGGDMFMRTILPMVLLIGVFYFVMFRGQKKERDKHKSMLEALKRNDRVQTIGGILGTVVEVRDNEVVLKVDETNNVKVRFNRAAIKEVLAEAPAPEKSPDKK